MTIITVSVSGQQKMARASHGHSKMFEGQPVAAVSNSGRLVQILTLPGDLRGSGRLASFACSWVKSANIEASAQSHLPAKGTNNRPHACAQSAASQRSELQENSVPRMHACAPNFSAFGAKISEDS
ncbi:hypothetical protein RRG08_020657 [Elysia crispata]|uniref:Uncharacterized protein n=1 Tax=Elysia crispata TaxID=231223 RepID=A0AAE0Z449_9GAST|nr:hypothetical protein RRG08_020657 [Elysia crispata]